MCLTGARLQAFLCRSRHVYSLYFKGAHQQRDRKGKGGDKKKEGRRAQEKRRKKSGKIGQAGRKEIKSSPEQQEEESSDQLTN